MSLLSGKHIVKEIGEVRCTIVETGCNQIRVAFLKKLLEANGMEVLSQEDKKKDEADPTTYMVGVTDVAFNPVIAVYQRHLVTGDGRKVTPGYWNQESDSTDPHYWSGN